jgi:hypothetical protein
MQTTPQRLRRLMQQHTALVVEGTCGSPGFLALPSAVGGAFCTKGDPQPAHRLRKVPLSALASVMSATIGLMFDCLCEPGCRCCCDDDGDRCDGDPLLVFHRRHHFPALDVGRLHMTCRRPRVTPDAYFQTQLTQRSFPEICGS